MSLVVAVVVAAAAAARATGRRIGYRLGLDGLGRHCLAVWLRCAPMLLILRLASSKLRSANTLLRVDAVSNGHNKEGSGDGRR